MAGRNTLIKQLRDMGVTDTERRQMRELAKEFESGDVYDKIAQLNKEVLGEYVRPSNINYQNMARSMQVTGKSFSELLEEYRQDLRNMQENTTTEIESYYLDVANDLRELGFQAKPETIKAIDQDGMMDGLLERMAFLKQYENQYNSQGIGEGSSLKTDIARAKSYIRELLSWYAL